MFHFLGCAALCAISALIAVPISSLGFTGVAALVGGLFVASLV